VSALSSQSLRRYECTNVQFTGRTVPVNISASTTGLSLMSFGEPGGAFSVASPSPLTMSGAWRIGTIFEPA
jgi:hypothetical protein